MGDHLRVGKPSRYVTTIKVDSAFYPVGDSKMNISFWAAIIINGGGGYGLLAVFILAL